MQDWKEVNGRLRREYTFPNFKSALEFINKVGELAEVANHHPDVQLSWGRVVIELWTHSVGKITEKDQALARKIDQIAI